MPLPRSGHAPTQIRETFCAVIDAFLDWRPGTSEPRVECEAGIRLSITLREACVLVWNCTDQLPGAFVAELREVAGLKVSRHSYASAARELHGAITHGAAMVAA